MTEPAVPELDFDLDQDPYLGTSVASFRPYEFADFSSGWRGSVEPHTLSDGQLAEFVERIVGVEQPIHEDEVGRRLAKVCGFQRAGGRIQEAAIRGLRAARRRGHLQSRQGFWSEDLMLR